MNGLIKFELGKIFQRKITLVAILVLVAFNWLIYNNWGAPSALVMLEDGGYAKGVEAVEMDQKICAAYEGTLTGDTVNRIIDDHMKKALATDVHANMDSAYDNVGMEFLYDYEPPIKDQDVIDKYGDESNRQFYYGFGWTRMLKYLTLLFIGLGFVLVVALSPMFSDEYQRGTDALIMTSRNGRKKIAAAKIIAAMIVAITLAVLIMGINFALFSATYGLDGWQMSINIDPEIQVSVDGMNVGTVAIYMAVLWFAAVIGTTSIVLMCSVLCKTSFMALLTSAVAYTAPFALTQLTISGQHILQQCVRRT